MSASPFAGLRPRPHVAGSVDAGGGPKDRFGRLLAYVYREPDGLFVNADLVRGGFARTLTIPPNLRFAGRFATLARQARRAGRGLWSACGPALGRLGEVFVAGCRDHDAARALGLVPTHGVGAAVQMAAGRAGGTLRLGFLLSPPYFPLRVRA